MKNKYSLSELLSTSWSLLLTFISFPQARLIRRPVYIRGKKSIDGANKLTTGHGCRFDLKGDKKTLYIGDHCEIGDNVHIVAYNQVKIGDNVLMASKVFISDTDHGSYKGDSQSSPFEKPGKRKLVSSYVEIGSNVWVGENAVILAGTKIGSGSVVGANSVVKGEFPANSIIAGAPAKVIKSWDNDRMQWTKSCD